MIFTKRYRYRFGDIDFAGIAYYPALLHYFHCAFEDWWADGLGVPYPQVFADDRFGLPAVNLQVDFFRPIRFGDEPDISLGVLDIGTSSVVFGMWMQVGGRTACRARITTVALDMDTRRKCDVPLRWRERFAQFAIGEDAFPAKGD